MVIEDIKLKLEYKLSDIHSKIIEQNEDGIYDVSDTPEVYVDIELQNEILFASGHIVIIFVPDYGSEIPVRHDISEYPVSRSHIGINVRAAKTLEVSRYIIELR